MDTIRSGANFILRPTSLKLFLGLWALVLLYGECFIYFRAITNCLSKTGFEFGKGLLEDNYLNEKILVVADPQLIDSSTYSYNRVPLLGTIIKFYGDNYMKRIFSMLIPNANVSSVVFLGDLMDGPKDISDSEWEESYKRFQNVFPFRSTSYYYVAGNHDIGYKLPEKQTTLLHRFEQ
jgi:metallophosphoesterase superfamily enzyme